VPEALPSLPPAPSASRSPALLAFLRGIERRAWVFAQAHCGDDALATRAVAAALREFVVDADRAALPRWPMLFWTRLSQQPALLEATETTSELSALTPGPRAALLLRLVGGLDFAHAADVLGVGEPAYRFALTRAVTSWSQAHPDPEALRRLRDDLQQRVRQLSAEQCERLADLRDRAMQGVTSSPTSPLPAEGAPRLRLRAWHWGALALLVLAFIATFVWPHRPSAQSGALPPVAAGVAPVLDDPAVVIHPDYPLLAAAQDEAAIRDLALLSWIGAGSPGVLATPATTNLPEPAADASPVAADGDVENAP